jgi:hypothetical protein
MLFAQSAEMIGAALIILVVVLGVGPHADSRRAHKPHSEVMSDHDIYAMLDQEFRAVSERRNVQPSPTAQARQHTGTPGATLSMPKNSNDTPSDNKATCADSRAIVRIVEAYIRTARRSGNVGPLLAIEVYEETGEDLGLVLHLYGPVYKLLSFPHVS